MNKPFHYPYDFIILIYFAIDMVIEVKFTI